MSRFREQLQAAKAEYDAIEYPFDLATQVLLAAPATTSRHWLKYAGALAAAAALVGAIWLLRPDTQHTTWVNNTEQTIDDQMPSLGRIPVVPITELTRDGEDLTPPASDMTIPVPTLSFGSAFSTDNSQEPT